MCVEFMIGYHYPLPVPFFTVHILKGVFAMYIYDAPGFESSPSHISRAFLKTYPTSPVHHLIYCQLWEACTYILNQNIPSQEIARKLAYKTIITL